MNERLKALRKALGLTQEQFAERIGVKRGAIANYEIGRNTPVDAVFSLICKEFNVNGNWLRTGSGEMFAPAPSSMLDALATKHELTHGEYILIEKFLSLRADIRQGIVDYVLEVAAALSVDDISAATPAAPESIDIESEIASF